MDNTVVYEYNFKSAPYYIYAQPYCSDFLTVRINIPKESVKLSQLPEILQRRVPRVPFKFKDCERFQIAEYTPCMSYYNDDIIVNLDGCQYSLLPTTEGGKAYFLESMHDIDFYPYCSEKDKYGCEKCSNYCATCNEHVFTDHPTVMIVVSPYSKFKYDYQFTSDIIIKNSIILPYLPIIPKPLGLWAFAEDAKKTIKTDELESLYLKNYQYLEDMLRRYNPQVVIADSKAYEALKKKYSLSGNVFDVGWKIFPFFTKVGVKSNRKEIERLALLSYHGKVFPRIISIDEMQKITENKHD